MEDSSTGPSRRKILSLLGGGSVSALAGCGKGPSQPSSPTTTVTANITSPGEEGPSPTATKTSSLIQVTDVSVSLTTVTQFQPVSIRISLKNAGTESGSVLITLRVDGEEYGSRFVTIEAGSTTTTGFEVELGTPGTHTLEVAGESRQIDVVETLLSVEVNTRSYWERLLFTCLQGIANRDRPQLYLQFQEADRRWLDWYVNEYDLTVGWIDDPYRLLRDGSLPIQGYVMVDILAPDTANLAASFAATENLLPVTERILQERDLPDLPVKRDLRDRFQDADKAATYQWAYENVWSDANQGVVSNLTTPRRITELDIHEYTSENDTIFLRFEDSLKEDGFGASLGGLSVLRAGTPVTRIIPGTAEESTYLYDPDDSWVNAYGRRIADKTQFWVYKIEGVRGADRLRLDIGNEYLIRIASAPDGPFDELARNESRGLGYYHNKIRDYVVAKQGFFVELASDPQHPEEREVKDRILANMEPPGQVFGWVDRFPDGSERHHVGHLSAHNRTVMVSYHDTSNFSVHHHVEVDPPPNPHPTSPDDVRVDDEKVYLMFSLSDGDALWMHSEFQGGDWVSSHRGDIPFGWELQPLLADIAPGMIDYYFKTATTNDGFFASASGIGSQFPNRMTESQLRRYLKQTEPYLDELDLRALWVRNDDPDGVSDSTAQEYERILGDHLNGVLERYWDRGGQERVIDDLAWVPTELPDTHPDGGGIKQQSAAELATAIETIATQTTRRPLFIPIHIPVTQPSHRPPGERFGLRTAVETVQELESDEFEVVRPEEFFVMYAKSHS